MPWVGFVYLMGHMLYSHLYRELYPVPGVVDVTGAQMVLVMKVRNPRERVWKALMGCRVVDGVLLVGS
jgi:hypothetical protein